MTDEKKWVIDLKNHPIDVHLDPTKLVRGKVPSEVQKAIVSSVEAAVIATLRAHKLMQEPPSVAMAAMAADEAEPIKSSGG